MKQYNRIMLGEHSRYIKDCLDNNYIGAGFLYHCDLSKFPYKDEADWRQQLIKEYQQKNPDKSERTAASSIGSLWTICFGLKKGDIVLAPDGNGNYQIGEITGDYYYSQSADLPHRRPVEWKEVVIQRKSMSRDLQNSTGSIGTCCNISRYNEELEKLISDGVQTIRSTTTVTEAKEYKECDLHKLFSSYLLDQGIYPKTILHNISTREDSAQKWVHPDIVGVQFNDFQHPATRSLLKTAETKAYIALYSYELKRKITNDSDLKMYFFQALSNSSWANYGYLVAFEIDDTIVEEMERLNRLFGIGVIKLSPYKNNTKIIFAARKNELDYYTIDKLCRMNEDFDNFITQLTNVINAQKDVCDLVRNRFQEDYCDKVFANDDEIEVYCKEKHIPLN